MTSNVLDEYNRQIEAQEICPKNNRGKEHDYKSINSIYFQEYCWSRIFCLECGNLKYIYNNLEEDMLWPTKKKIIKANDEER